VSSVKRSLGSVFSSARAALNIALRPRIFWPGLLIAAFIVSAAVSFSFPSRRATVLWFPEATSEGGARAELRYIRSDRDAARTAASIVEEMLLGPLVPTSRPISVPSARLISSIRSDKTLYVDVSSDILFGRLKSADVYDSPPLQPRAALAFIDRTLRWNLPLYKIVITVGGNEPSWEPSLMAK